MQALSFLDNSSHPIFLQQELTGHQKLIKDDVNHTTTNGSGKKQRKWTVSKLLSKQIQIHKLCLPQFGIEFRAGNQVVLEEERNWKSKLAFLSKCISKFLQRGTKSFYS